MIERIIEASARNKFLVFIFTLLASPAASTGCNTPRSTRFPILATCRSLFIPIGKGVRPTLSKIR
jgi:hypothetical protein